MLILLVFICCFGILTVRCCFTVVVTLVVDFVWGFALFGCLWTLFGSFIWLCWFCGVCWIGCYCSCELWLVVYGFVWLVLLLMFAACKFYFSLFSLLELLVLFGGCLGFGLILWWLVYVC